MKILCLTDLHGKKKKLSLVLQKEGDIDLILVAGDITHLGGYKEAAGVLQSLMESGIKILAVHGNMDKKEVNTFLDDKGMSIHGRCVVYEEKAFIGLGGSNPTPFGTPQEYAESDVSTILKDALQSLPEKITRIFVSHAPPENTCLDVIRGAGHVGSGAVRKIIQTHAIDLCICGHIHETGGTDTIEKSICVNPGPFREGNYAIVGITEAGINVMRRKI